ncbi:hypothetical protein TRFO_42593 [Tritrichomonas foetus]|uniref:Uncharacterized protein n=1 Tax=Tritrichomonas foetus TaxID=1144522 RepID=A0A1J4L075_9EUKA|nr:hypothetical protein TRFO_42593 [Tritrichomonas foetus]|eukprot:OHT15332.1 hypothetical protein TRFO_42593 [Tritrichomonas foetus]
MKSNHQGLEQINNAIHMILKISEQNASILPDLKLRTEQLLEIFSGLNPKQHESKSEVQNEDRKKADIRLQGFNPLESQVWREICQKYGSSLSQNELLSLAEVIASHIGTRVDREAKRRKEVLIKWFDENSEKILAFLPYVIIEDMFGRPPIGSQMAK